MKSDYFHYDNFEVFGQKLHRIILLPSDKIFYQFASTIKQNNYKNDGFFWMKFMLSVTMHLDMNAKGDFDFDAEKDACIVCHPIINDLQKLVTVFEKIMIDQDKIQKTILEIRDVPSVFFEDDLNID
jgi:hypothetical protein